MSDKENRRKCFKCGKSPATDNVKLFRFPKPGVRNLLRCALWAKYMFASEEQYGSIDFQKKLFSEHRMLCQNHFVDADFTDASKTRLLYTAIPTDIARVSITLPAYEVQPTKIEERAKHSPIFQEPRAGTSRDTATEWRQIYQEPHPSTSKASQAGHGHVVQEPQAGTSKTNPLECKHLKNITNIKYEKSATQEVREARCTSETHKLHETQLKTDKEKNLYRKCAKYMRSLCNLRNRLKKLKKKIQLNALTEENSVKKLAKKLSPTFACLLQGQIRNFNKSTGRRWTKEEKIVALRLFKRSPTCYRLLRRLFQLPSPGTLKALLNKMPFDVGVTKPVLDVLKNFIKSQQPSDNEFTLMFDEMSIKKHFNYNKKEDILEGYQDHGSQGRSPNVATHALVFMVAGIRKRVKQPIAHYFSSSYSTADRLAVLIKEILQKCFEAGIKISATVCDMDGVNRRALAILGATVERPYISVQNNEIVTLFDTPHLLKCFRNLFMKHDIEYTTNITSEGKIGKGLAKWSHIQEFHEIDQANKNFVFAPALTKDHLNPNQKQKMRVKLAAQVLSHTVAAGMYAKVSDGTLTPNAAITANIISNIDKLFDSLNSDTSDLRRGKVHATNMTEKSPHLLLFGEMKKFFKTMKFVGCQCRPPSQDGWIWTINGIERLFKNLKSAHNIKSLATRRLQQDPLENLFGCIRSSCGSNTNPTTGQFVAGLKTAIISNMAHIGTTANCEADDNIILNNFSTLLSDSQSTQQIHDDELMTHELMEETALSSLITEDIEEDDAEIQACAYICGFLIKKQIAGTCNNCSEVLVSPNINKAHGFIQYKEYSDAKNSLNYASIDLIRCVESCANITNTYLSENGHNKGLKKKIVAYLKLKVNFDFLKHCKMHCISIINLITNSIFHICIKRFCFTKNRLFADEASASALKRKVNIILHK